MSPSFTEKVAIVTGSSKGIGRTIALELLSKGCRVVINGRDPERLESTLHDFRNLGFEPLAIAGDVNDPAFCSEMMEKTAEQWGGIDILVNNAGLPMRGNFEDLKPEFFRRVVEINLMTAVYCTMAALPYLKKSRGSVVFISSISGGVRGIPHSAPYSVGKMGLTALAQTLRTELSQDGIHFGLIRVGFVKLYEGKRVLNHDGSYIEVKRNGHQTEQDVARAVVRIIRSRHFMITQTLIGKAMALLQWLMPGFVTWYLIRTRNSSMYK